MYSILVYAIFYSSLVTISNKSALFHIVVSIKYVHIFFSKFTICSKRQKVIFEHEYYHIACDRVRQYIRNSYNFRSQLLQNIIKSVFSKDQFETRVWEQYIKGNLTILLKVIQNLTFVSISFTLPPAKIR